LGEATLGSITHLRTKVRKVKFNPVYTHAEVVTSKSYVDAHVAKEVNLEVANLIVTSKSTKILDFLSKIQR
jgi:hypothetical protein